MRKTHPFKVGAKYPLPFADNLCLQIDVEHGRPRLLLRLALPVPTPREVSALLTGPLRFSLTPSSPLLWFVLTADGLSFEAPYDVHSEDREIKQAIIAALMPWTISANSGRQLAFLDVVDTRSGTLVAARIVSVSGDWMAELARAVAAQQPLTAAERIAATARDHRRWPRIASMVSAAMVSEIAGRV